MLLLIFDDGIDVDDIICGCSCASSCCDIVEDNDDDDDDSSSNCSCLFLLFSSICGLTCAIVSATEAFTPHVNTADSRGKF